MISKREIDIVLKNSKILFWLAGPIILSNLLHSFYNLADTYYMGKLGSIELAAASFTSPITQMIIGAGTGFSVGGGIIISQVFGKKDKKQLIEMSSQLLSINLILSMIIMLISFIFCENILIFSGVSSELLDKSSLYIKFIFATIPMTFIVSSYTTIKNCKGKTIAPLYLIFYSVLLNIILNSIFVYKLKMGLFGIGLATLIANLLLSIYCLYDLKIRKEISLNYFKIKYNNLKRIVKLGVPSSITAMTNALSFIVINTFVVKYGNEVLAAYGIGNRINSIIYVLVNGIGSAIAILVGQNIGARKLKQAKKVLKIGMGVGIILGILMIILLYLNLNYILNLLTNDNLIKYHSKNYVIIMLASIIPWVIFQSFSGVFQGTGHTKFNMYCHFGRVWFFRLPFIYFFEKILRMNEFSIWYSMLFSNLFVLMFSILLYQKVNWYKKI